MGPGIDIRIFQDIIKRVEIDAHISGKRMESKYGIINLLQNAIVNI